MRKSYVVNQVDHYTIEYLQQRDGTIAMHAISHPTNPYGRDVTKSHLYSDGQICVLGGHEPRTMDRAKAIAVQWMEGFSVYIRTGTFPNKGRRVHV